jgi:hypothetical protein
LLSWVLQKRLHVIPLVILYILFVVFTLLHKKDGYVT